MNTLIDLNNVPLMYYDVLLVSKYVCVMFGTAFLYRIISVYSKKLSFVPPVFFSFTLIVHLWFISTVLVQKIYILHTVLLLLILLFLEILLIKYFPFNVKEFLIKLQAAIKTKHFVLTGLTLVWTLMHTFMICRVLMSRFVYADRPLYHIMLSAEMMLSVFVFSILGYFSFSVLSFLFNSMKLPDGYRINLDLHSKDIVILTVIISVTAFIRFTGITFGLPLLIHPDEWTIIEKAVQMVQKGLLNPYNYNRPDHVTIWTNYIVLNITSFLVFFDNLGNTFKDNVPFFYLVSRSINVVISLLLVAAAYIFGKKRDRTCAIICSLLFALFPMISHYSRFITPEILTLLFSLLIIYYCVLYIEKKETAYLNIAALFCVLFSIEKYPGVLSTVLIFASHVMVEKKFIKSIQKSFKQFKVYLAAFLITAPSLVFYFNKTYSRLSKPGQGGRIGKDYMGYFDRVFNYMELFVEYSGFIMLFVLAACVIILIIKREKNLVLFLFGYFYLFVMSIMDIFQQHWAVVSLVTPILIIGFGLSYLTENKTIRPVVALLLGISFFSQTVESYTDAYNHSLTDTINSAREFCEKNGINEENTLFERYTPLYGGTNHMYAKIHVRNLRYTVENAKKYEYVILSSRSYARYYKHKNHPASQRKLEFYNYVRETENFTLLQKYEPNSKGPEESDNEIVQIIENLKYLYKGITTQSFTRGYVIEIYKNNISS